MGKHIRPNNFTYKTPKRGEVWLVVDKAHHGKIDEQEFDSSVQGGTRTCVVVSNDTGNTHAPVVMVVYTTTKQKNPLPTHFETEATPTPSTVMCEQIMTVPKNNLVKYYGALSMKEKCMLDKCLKVSLGL